MLGLGARADAGRSLRVLYGIARAGGAVRTRRRSASPWRSRRAASSRSCCSRPPAAIGILDSRTRAAAGHGRHAFDAARAARVRRCTSGCSSAWLRAHGRAGVRHDRRPGNPGHHRRLRPLRPDRVARAAHVRHPVHRARGQLPAGRFRAPLRQQDLLRRRVAASSCCRRPRPARRKLFVLAIDDVEASVKTAALVRRHFPGPADPRARAQPRALLPPARPRHRVDLSRDLSRQPRSGAPGAAAAGFRRRCGPACGASLQQHDDAELAAEYAVHHDEAQLIQTTRQAAEQLRELFEADVARRPRGFPERPTVETQPPVSAH